MKTNHEKQFIISIIFNDLDLLTKYLYSHICHYHVCHFIMLIVFDITLVILYSHILSIEIYLIPDFLILWLM